MSSELQPDIIYTIVDEAPELASASLLPVIKAFSKAAGVKLGSKDISLAGRILAEFPDFLDATQQRSNDLELLGKVVLESSANIIKLPNISASVPQLISAIKELQKQGFRLPDYPASPKSQKESDVKLRYDNLKGSAVNPVLREGNSDRRAAKSVKKYAMNNPHSMGVWSSNSKTRVSSMGNGDFYSNEKSTTISLGQVGKSKIVFYDSCGNQTILKDEIIFNEGDVVDSTFMEIDKLRKFIQEQIALSSDLNILFSVHLKSTMMKVSDPIIFGHFVSVFFDAVFKKYSKEFSDLGINANSGLGEIFKCISDDAEIVESFKDVMQSRPELYMVDSDHGITNLHVPSDVIIDASMPAIIRAGGKGWGPDGKEKDTNCIIPDGCYAPIYDETIKYFIETGALDPRSSGSVDNVGLMAQKAEEYGSHPTTFEMANAGVIKIILESGEILHEHLVNEGDIWRCSTSKKAPILDWIKLGIERQKITGSLAIFWLDKNRAHDNELIRYVDNFMNLNNFSENFKILSPRDATRLTLETIRKGEDVIAITGNVLRDYLTDLFPILELGTSAKMLSIVKLMNGGGLFETGAGGSAPKHVQQLAKENHLRWDSLGEFCALAESFRFLSKSTGNKRALCLSEAVEIATQKILDLNRSPKRKVGQQDNRTSHFYFALYWSEAIANQALDVDLASSFKHVSKALKDNESLILEEFKSGQGTTVDLGGYYLPNAEKVESIMRPSKTFNQIIASVLEL